MRTALESNSYGKSSVRLSKVVRGAARHELIELTVDISLEGDFAASYEGGDNRNVVATDSMKNTVYVLAAENRFTCGEEFAPLLGRHFVQTYPQVKRAAVRVEQDVWERIDRITFVGAGAERRVCNVSCEKGQCDLTAGIAGLKVLKTTDSEFKDFVTDRYRTLKDTGDRILASMVDATWSYGAVTVDGDAAYAAIRAAMLKAFAGHHSLSVQQTLLEMGKAALSACPQMTWIDIAMPNQHRIPFDLRPFGLENKNEIFVTTSEPYGLIRGRVRRDS